MRPWLRLNSIFGRFIVLHTLAMIITSAVILGAAYFLFNGIFLRFEYRTLQQYEGGIAAALHHTSARGWTVQLPAALGGAERDGGFTYVVVAPDGRTLLSSSPKARSFLPDNSPGVARYIHANSGGSALAAASFPETRAGAEVWVQVAQDLGNRDQITDDVLTAALTTLLWVVPGMVILLALADALIVRRALRPVIAASLMAQEIHPDRIGLRLPTDHLPAEIQPLAAAVNKALDRLEDGFRIQREFTADAAHELRTPLTVVRLRIDTLCEPEIAAALKADIDVMSRIVGQLLSIAELEAGALDPLRRADLTAVAARVASYLAPMAVHEHKELAFLGPNRPVWVKGDDVLLFQAVRNLAENAITHTPRGTAVEIEVDAAGSVRVLDRGPGVPETDRLLLFGRFWRHDRKTSNGAGLGLSIVARIAEAHGGRITVSGRSGGGAVFDLQLQLATPAGPMTGPVASLS